MTPTCLHLPDVDGAVSAADDEEVVQGSPLDHLDGEELSWCQHDALAFLEAEQCQRVVAGYRADTGQNTNLRKKAGPHFNVKTAFQVGMGITSMLLRLPPEF